MTAFGGGRRLELRRVTDGTGQLVALLPLIEIAPGRLMLTGGSDVSDYLDLIALGEREEEAWTALLAARAADRSVWELHAVPAASPTVTAVPALARRRRSHRDERGRGAMSRAAASGHLGDLPRFAFEQAPPRARAARSDASSVKSPPAGSPSRRTPTGVAARLDDFLDLHRQSRVGKARFMDERMEGFFRRVIVALAAQGAARLNFLDTPAGPIASFVTLEWDDTVGLYNSGFRPDCAALSPGLVLLAGLVRDALERGRRCFDFLQRRGALQVRVRSRAGGGARGDHRGPVVSLRVAILSVHTCPLAVLGGKETGGMNVYVRELARELGRMGVRADVFTRSQNPTIPRVVTITEGVRVVHLTAGPEAPMPRERIRDHLDEFVEGVEAFRIARWVRLRPDSRPLLALGRGRARAPRPLVGAAGADVPHARPSQERRDARHHRA